MSPVLYSQIGINKKSQHPNKTCHIYMEHYLPNNPEYLDQIPLNKLLLSIFHECVPLTRPPMKSRNSTSPSQK